MSSIFYSTGEWVKQEQIVTFQAYNEGAYTYSPGTVKVTLNGAPALFCMVKGSHNYRIVLCSTSLPTLSYRIDGESYEDYPNYDTFMYGGYSYGTQYYYIDFNEWYKMYDKIVMTDPINYSQSTWFYTEQSSSGEDICRGMLDTAGPYIPCQGIVQLAIEVPSQTLVVKSLHYPIAKQVTININDPNPKISLPIS